MLKHLRGEFSRWYTRRKNSRLIFVPIASIGVAATLVAVLATIWAGSESDRAALERQKELVTAKLADQVNQFGGDITMVATGYASLLSQNERGSDQTDQQGAQKFGETVTSVFGFEEMLLVDQRGDLVFERDTERARRYEWIRPLLGDLFERVRNEHPPVAGTLEPGPTATANAEIMRLEGRASIVGITPVFSDGSQDNLDAQGLSQPTHYYLIAFRFVDGAILNDLSGEMGLKGARYARTKDADDGEVAFQVAASSTGDPIGVIIWTPDLPGSRVIERLTPFLCAAITVIGVLFWLLVLRLSRSWRELRRSEEHSRELALQDVLTRLPNRELFARRLDECFTTASSDTGIVIGFIDLDRFKAVNDSFGHAAGDELIIKAADRMREILAGRGTLARLGGDEFGILASVPQQALTGPIEIFAEIVSEIERPFLLQHGDVTAYIGCSIGIAASAEHHCEPQELLRRADVALYQAKARGRGCYVVYDAEFETGQRERDELVHELRTELAMIEAASLPGSVAEKIFHPALEVHFQTIHRAGNESQISGAEALIRWRHPRLGLLPPDRFIPLAESTGLIDSLGRFILEQACRTGRSHLPNKIMSVNVSPRQLKNSEFADTVLSILDKTGFAPSRLELELTETALVDNPQQAKDSLGRLRSKGVRIALDDFGTGYSSLSHLINFGIDRIKIDRSFVRLLDTQSNGAAIAAAVTSLARNLGMETTAEGVETQGQRDFLVAIGCNDLQGYLFSRPVAAEHMWSDHDPQPITPSANRVDQCASHW